MRIKDLKCGDRVTLAEGGTVGVVTAIARCRIVETAPGTGEAYEVKWQDDKGETGQMIVAGNHSVEVR